jgi:hypothetical protein
VRRDCRDERDRVTGMIGGPTCYRPAAKPLSDGFSLVRMVNSHSLEKWFYEFACSCRSCLVYLKGSFWTLDFNTNYALISVYYPNLESLDHC